MAHAFRPGDEVIWAKGVGGFAYPVLATVVAVTPKRVTIRADDPDETGAGWVTRHVRPESLQPRVEMKPRGQARRRAKEGSRLAKDSLAADSFEARYPHIASWVQDGWVEIGRDDCDRPFLRAMDIGGLAWEGDETYSSLDEALRALDQGIADWLKENE